MRFAYADPPYIGQAKKHYSHDPNCAEVDHEKLIFEMTQDYDGWALSCSSPSLRQLLPLCPDTVRVGIWVKPFCAFKANVNPAYAWEPVIFYGGRKRSRQQETTRDWISELQYLKANIAAKHISAALGYVDSLIKASGTDVISHEITLKKGLVGAKPEAFCNWVLDWLNVQEGDVVDDLFPGTGIFTQVINQRLTALIEAK